jgi:preprotein translocase subunit YajC
MFGKVFAGIATAGVLAGVLATGAMAAPAATASASPAKTQRPAAKDVFAGTVTAINETQITIKNAKSGSKTFLRTDATVVVKGRNEKASWSEIEVNSHVSVRYETRDGKLYLKRVHIGRAHMAGKVQSVNGNVITIRTRDGKDVKLTVNAATKYFQVTGKKQRQPGSLSDIKAGTRLMAAGSYDASHNFDAAIVAYRNK